MYWIWIYLFPNNVWCKKSCHRISWLALLNNCYFVILHLLYPCTCSTKATSLTLLPQIQDHISVTLLLITDKHERRKGIRLVLWCFHFSHPLFPKAKGEIIWVLISDFWFRVQKNGQTTTRVTKPPTEIHKAPTKALSNMWAWAPKSSSAVPPGNMRG